MLALLWLQSCPFEEYTRLVCMEHQTGDIIGLGKGSDSYSVEGSGELKQSACNGYTAGKKHSFNFKSKKVLQYLRAQAGDNIK